MVDQRICQCSVIPDHISFDNNDFFSERDRLLNYDFILKIEPEKYKKAQVFYEDWCKCQVCHKKWRLIEPDQAYRGEIELIDKAFLYPKLV